MATRLTLTTPVSPNSLHNAGRPTYFPLETSDESKQHSKEVLEQEFDGGNVQKDSGDKNPNNVAGGLKAYDIHSKLFLHLLIICSTTKNPNVSDEAKQSAEERLKEMGQ